MEGALRIPRKEVAIVRSRVREVATFLLLLLSGYLVILRHSFIFSHHYPISTDGFYYLIEYRSWIEQQASFYDRFSPGTILVGLTGALLNLTPEVLYNGALLATLWGTSLCLYLLASSQSTLFASLLFAAFWGSDLLFYRHYAFLNQALSVTLALGAVLADERLKGASRYSGVSLLSLVSALIHPFGGALCSVLVTRHIISNKLIAPLLIVVLVVALFGMQQVERDIFQPPSLEVSWLQACTFANCSPQEYGEFTVVTLLILFLLFRAPRSRSTPFALLFLLLQSPIWSHEEQVAQRLAFGSAWVAFLSLSVSSLPLKEAISGGAALLLITLLPGKSYTDPYPSTALLALHKERLRQWIPEDATVVAPHGMQFRITYLLGRRSRREVGSDEDTPLFLHGYIARRRRCKDINTTSSIDPLTPCLLLSGAEGIERIR